jgi:CheY-like chemotaxis protein
MTFPWDEQQKLAELTTALSGILGTNELLLQTSLSAEQLELAMTVQASGQSLLTVLNDLLEPHNLDNVPFNIIYVVHDAVRLMAAAAKRNQIELSTKIDFRLPELLVGDRDKVRRVLLSLIGKAVKYTNKSELLVRADLIDSAENLITIRFSVDDHYFVLSFITANARSVRFSPKRAASVFSPKESTVLLAENNAIVQEQASKFLAEEGWHVVPVHTGAQAIQATLGTAFDLILIDCNLPVVDGFRTARAIRDVERSCNRYTKIIAIAEADELPSLQKCQEFGIDDVLKYQKGEPFRLGPYFG